jgi:hypothetical protein
VPPVASEVKGPKVVVVLSGLVTTTVSLPHLSPNCPLAVGGGSPSQKLTRAVCPTPIGFGETLQKENVGIFKGGECALAFGKSVMDVVIMSVKHKTIAIVEILFLTNFISSFLLFSVKFCFG